MRLLQTETPQQLNEYLRAAGIETQTWETPEQSLEELWQETRHSDCHLVQDENGSITRRVRIVAVVVRFQDKVLVEHTQSRNMDKDIRHRRIAGSLIETLLGTESPEEGALRVLAEEMNLHAHSKDLSSFEQGIVDALSPSYPGLRTEYHIYRTSIEMPIASYQAEYQVEFDEWTTTWKWVSQSQSAQFFQDIS